MDKQHTQQETIEEAVRQAIDVLTEVVESKDTIGYTVYDRIMAARALLEHYDRWRAFEHKRMWGNGRG